MKPDPYDAVGLCVRACKDIVRGHNARVADPRMEVDLQYDGEDYVDELTGDTIRVKNISVQYVVKKGRKKR